MKKYLFTIAAVAFALCACKKVETGTNEVAPGANEEVGAPQQILIGTNLKSSELVTKASVDYWNGQKVYVIGYDNSKIASATEVIEDAGFIMPNKPGTTPSNDQYSENALKGQLTFDGKFYYDENVDSYDFNGYYLGETVTEAPEIALEGGLMTVDFEIDGSQDILGAITNVDADRVINEGTQMVKKDYVYSAFASHRGVKPTLIFNHMLTKFSFEVKYGSNTGAEHFHLGTIGIETVPEGTLYINPKEAERKLTPYVEASAEAEIDILDIDCSEFAVADATGVYKPAGSLMVMPGEASYKMVLSYTQDQTDGKTHYFAVPIDIHNVSWDEEGEHTEAFMPGKQYKVKVTVYGLEKIEVNVELVPWEEVGFVTIDPDDPTGKIEGPGEDEVTE